MSDHKPSQLNHNPNHAGKSPDDETQRLRAMLVEDLGSSDAADDFLPTVQRLRQWRPLEAQSSGELLKVLAPELPRPKTRLARLLDWYPFLLIRSQVRVVRREIWAASLLVMALGTFVTLADASANLLSLSVVAPIVAAVGVALLYDSDVERILELEDSTPISPRRLLLARLTLVFGFDLMLGLIGSVFLAAFQAQLSLWSLVMSWLAPMAFLSGLAFLLSVLFVDAVAGAVFSLILWGMHVVLRVMPSQNEWMQILSLPGLANPDARPLLLGAAAALIVIALWLVGHVERNIGEVI